MLKLKTRDQLWLGVLLGLLMAVTRGQHAVALAHTLPDASLAIFFLAGFYLRPAWAFGILFAEGLLLDLAAIAWGGVGGFCMTPAYLFLIPAYGAMWAAGRWYAERYRATLSTVLPLVGCLLLAGSAAELLASGGFYLFSGRFEDLSSTGLWSRLIEYFPTSLKALALYIGLVAVIHGAVATIRTFARKEDLSAG